MFSREANNTQPSNRPGFSFSLYLLALNLLYILNKASASLSGASRNDRSIYFFDESRQHDYKFTATEEIFYDFINYIQQGVCGADSNILARDRSSNYINLGSWENGAELYRGSRELTNTTMEACLENKINLYDQAVEQHQAEQWRSIGILFGGTIGSLCLLACVGAGIMSCINARRHKETAEKKPIEIEEIEIQKEVPLDTSSHSM